MELFLEVKNERCKNKEVIVCTFCILWKVPQIKKEEEEEEEDEEEEKKKKKVHLSFYGRCENT